MTIIAYEKKYKDQVLDLWNKTLIADPLSEKRFYKTILFDENFDPEYFTLAIKDEKVIGFVWAVKRKVPYGDLGLEPKKAWVAAMAVDEKHQRQGVGTDLLKETESRLFSKGVNNIILGAYTPNYFFPGVDIDNYPYASEFFKKNNYEKYGEAVSMERSLFNFAYTPEYLKLKEKVKKKGYQLTPFTLSDSEELIEFLQENFPGDWANNVKQAILKDEATETVIVLRDKENHIVGYAQRAIDGNPDRFGPFGVKETLRGEGLGAILFNEMLFSMISKGVSHAYFLWTGGSAQKFYERNGMEVYRTYELMKK